MEPKDATKQVFTANLMPSRGSWLELEIDKKGIVYARIDRKRKLPIPTLLRALPEEDPSTGFKLDTSSNEALLKLFDNSIFMQLTSRRTRQDRRAGPDRGLQGSAAAGRAPDGRECPEPAQLAVLRPEALRPDQGQPLQAEPAPRGRRARRRGADDAGHPFARQAPRRPADEARRPRTPRTTPPTAPRSRVTRSAASSTSTRTSATGAFAPSAS